MGEHTSSPGPADARPILVDDPARLAADLVEGYASVWDRYVRRDADGLVVRATPKPAGRVGLAIGNGLGHEPAMLGLVGPGLFDVNIPGDLFAAPGPLAIATGVRAADRGAGVVLCVSNHSGDVLAANLAVGMLADGDPECRTLVLWDDVSTAPSHGPERRGGIGLLFVWKILGAAAEAGLSLDECERIGVKVRDGVRSLSAVLAGTQNPVTGQAVSPVAPGTALVGAGVHGDSTGEVVECSTARALAEHLVSAVAGDLGLTAGDHCGLVVNDAGAMSVLESTLVAADAQRWLAKEGVVVDRVWAGRYATTLATAGVGVAVCRFDDELLGLWDAECSSPALSTPGAARGR